MEDAAKLSILALMKNIMTHIIYGRLWEETTMPAIYVKKYHKQKMYTQKLRREKKEGGESSMYIQKLRLYLLDT